jgi:hypothetical protein
MPSLGALIDQVFDIPVFVAILDLFNKLVGMTIAIVNNLLEAFCTEKIFGSLLNGRILFLDEIDEGGGKFDIHTVEDGA